VSDSIKVTTGDLRNQAKSISDVAMLISDISRKNSSAINKMTEACSFLRVGSISFSAIQLIDKFTQLLETLNRGASKTLECAIAFEEASDQLKGEYDDWFEGVEAGAATQGVFELNSGGNHIPLNDYFRRVSHAEYAKICGMWGWAAMSDNAKEEFIKKLKEGLPEGDPLRDITADQVEVTKSGTGFAAVTITDDNGNALVIFAGTNGDAGDIFSDAELTLAIESDQERQAWELIDSLRKTHSNIVVTGHSLGGYLATSATLQYSEISKCVCFDPPGRYDSSWHYLTNNQSWSKVTTYEANGSKVSSVGSAVGDLRKLDVVENGGIIDHNHSIDEICNALGGDDRINLSWEGQGGW